MVSISSILWFVLPALLSAIFVVALIGPARRFGLVDHPAGRKNHSVSPLVGGIAIFLSMVLTHVLAGGRGTQSVTLMVALLVTVGIGVADDAHEIGHRSKFFAQLIAALLIVSGTEVHVAHLGDIFALGDVVLDKWSYLVTVIAIIGLMNAFNMIDGLDGLAGSQVLIPLLIFWGVAHAAGNANLAMELLVLAGAVSGFLLFNLRAPWRKRALVFMGDTGGLLLGLLLAWYSIKLGGAAHCAAQADYCGRDTCHPLAGHGVGHVSAHDSTKEPLCRGPPALTLHPGRRRISGQPGGRDDGGRLDRAFHVYPACRSAWRVGIRDVRRLRHAAAGLYHVAGAARGSLESAWPACISFNQSSGFQRLGYSGAPALVGEGIADLSVCWLRCGDHDRRGLGPGNGRRFLGRGGRYLLRRCFRVEENPGEEGERRLRWRGCAG